MFNDILGMIIENEQVEVYEKTTTVKPSGGTSIQWTLAKTILCNIQANTKYGEALTSSTSGDVVNAVYNLYTRTPLQEGLRIKRIEDDGLIYEIRNVEHNGRKTILEHYKAYLTRLDNQ
jgi:hypothetical protein